MPGGEAEECVSKDPGDNILCSRCKKIRMARFPFALSLRWQKSFTII